MRCTCRKGESARPIAPLLAYGGVSLSNFVATWCQYEALKSISFPTQTLGKCGKILPVLVLGTLGLGAKKYGKHEYFEGLMVTAGWYALVCVFPCCLVDCLSTARFTLYYVCANHRQTTRNLQKKKTNRFLFAC